ncbi:MAG: carbohydrate ABC transporter substrate-binding protein [Chloroflexi bacterium]|nr:carbohydrate ABC transporter substrate-binding protein [Chloroflexota bacterium]
MARRCSRRSFAFGLAAGGALLLAACGAPAAAPTTAPAAKPTEAPKPAAPAAGAATAAPTAAAAAAKPASGEKVALTWWTHGAEEENKKKMLALLVKTFEGNNPNVSVQITWTQMPGIWQALQAAFTADSGYPDILWFGLTQRQWIDAGWIADLTQGITWENVAPWAKQAATLNGPDGKPGVWFFTEFASTGELYYNKQMFADFGITVPANGQFPQDQFKSVVKTVADKGVTPFANANGDRDYPGQTMPSYLLLSKLGTEDLVKLWKGEIPFTDPRVVDVFTYFEELVKLKAYPATFSSMTLSESHNYFHTQKKAAMFPVPSWYTARAFVPADKGGQPKDFPLGFLAYPAMTDGKGIKNKYLDPGGSQTAAAKSKNRDLAIKVLNGYTDIAWATEWVGTTGNPTAVKIDATKIKSDFPGYWEAYFKAQEGITHQANLGPAVNAKPAQNEVWTKVASQGMPAGLITAKDAITQLDEGWKKGAK